MEEHEYGFNDEYDSALIERLTDYFTEKTHGEFLLCCSEHPNEFGGVCAISFIEDGHPQLIMFDYVYPERMT
jgi:hypothetical protein